MQYFLEKVSIDVLHDSEREPLKIVNFNEECFNEFLFDKPFPSRVEVEGSKMAFMLKCLSFKFCQVT